MRISKKPTSLYAKSLLPKDIIVRRDATYMLAILDVTKENGQIRLLTRRLDIGHVNSFLLPTNEQVRHMGFVE